jgi:hypothetical protein
MALVMGVALLIVAATLLALTIAGAILLGGAWLGYRVLRAVFDRDRPRLESRQTRRRGLSREARGLLEMARTPDPLDRYLLAVNEYARLSTAILAVDPADLPRRRSLRRAADLCEQADNLHDAVQEIERQAGADASADGAMANVWELSVATGELWAYCRDLSAVRRAPVLSQVRSFVSRRTALLTRRDALVVRLNDARLRTAPEPAVRIPVRTVEWS